MCRPINVCGFAVRLTDGSAAETTQTRTSPRELARRIGEWLAAHPAVRRPKW